MVCETAEELEARLVLRSLLPPEDGDVEPGPSLLHRRMRAELNEVLESSFKRRLARIEKKVAILCDGSAANGASGGFAPPPRAAAPAARPGAETGVQTDEEEPVCTVPLVASMKVALARAATAARKPPKVFGPTPLQGTLPDPKEEKEDLPVSETHAMKGTLESLGRSLSSRERQIRSLQQQLQHCQELYEERTQEADEGAQSLRELLANPGKLHEAHGNRAERRLEHVRELTRNLEKSKQQARHYQNLAQQQRAFFLQGERISATGGADALAKHPAGEVALVPRPPPMTDEKPEVWDVGTAIANPYVVDSWPFEPNVLASRISKEATMESCVEETAEDLEEERRRLPFRPLRLPGRRLDEDDDYDDAYGGQTGTSRSL